MLHEFTAIMLFISLWQSKNSIKCAFLSVLQAEVFGQPATKGGG